MNNLSAFKKELKKLASPEKAKFLSRYFKTGIGEYGFGDIFLGISVPDQRKVAYKFIDLSLNDLEDILKSKIHEYRFTALEILVAKYEKGSLRDQEKIFKFYLKQIPRINNWDLVDTSASGIVGKHLYQGDRKILYKLAKSKNLWERRIAIVSTHYFIAQKDLKDSLSLCLTLLKDDQDLIHKALGWTLREVGKVDLKVLKDFLKKNYSIIPRTTLRYAIERFPENLRKKYLKGLI